MQKNKTLVFAVAIFAMLLMSPMLIIPNSASRMAFATDYSTNNDNSTNNSNETSDVIYVNGTSHDGTLVVHIESKTPKTGEALPTTIWFTDANGAEVRHVHYGITAEQDGNQVLSLRHVFLNQGSLEYNTQALSSDNPVYIQVTILGIGLPYDKPNWTGPIGDVIDLQIGEIQPPPPSLSVSADQSSYHHGDTATIKAALTGYGQGQNIAITVSNPGGDVMVSRTIVTDESGTAQLEFKIPDSYQDGTYQVVATASAGGMVYRDTTEFSVVSEPAHFTIVSVEATDQNGNPVSSFNRGSTGYAKVVVSAESNQTALITTDLFDSNSVSLGVGSVKTNLGAGESQMIVSFFVPKDAAAGTANIFANAFDDWPSNGGTPLTGELSTTVEIQ